MSKVTRRRWRARSAALLAALTIASLAACASIPTSGPVREGLQTLDQFESSIVFRPSGPSAGASQEEIVRGFVRAASSSAGDYEVARQFLTPRYAEQWDPWLGALVDEGTQQYAIAEEGVAVLSLRLAASVDASGRLTPAPPGGTTTVMFELVEHAGEWRISSAPTGIILDKGTFTEAWTARSVYFLSGDNRLVPETRWFLNRPTLSTQIVRELLAGPPEASADALHTAFPPGTVLLSESVPVVNGTAVIDLSAELFDAEPAETDLLKRQLAASLQPVPGVQRIELRVHGAVVDEVPVAIADETSASEQQYVTVLKDGEFGVAVADTVRPIAGLSELVVNLRPTAVTVAPDRKTAAVRHPGGVSWVSESAVVLIDGRQNLLEPSLDALGFVWVSGAGEPGTIMAAKPGGDVMNMTMPWLDGRTPVAARVSMGGSRLAVLVAEQDDSSVLVADIVRNELGEPIALSETASTQLWADGSPVDLDWIDENRFAALTETGLLGTSRRITIGEVGKFSIDGGAVAGGSSISGGGSRALLRVLDDQHRLFQPQGSGWQVQQSEVELLAKVG